MSCAYRHAATRIATMAGIPPDLMLTAMDAVRQRRVTFPDLPPDRRLAVTQRLGIAPTCGNPQQVIARAQSALLALGTLHPTHPCIERWMAIAAELGVPDDHLPAPVNPTIMETVHQQWMTDLPTTDDRGTTGIRALRNGTPIPTELIDEAIRAKDRQAIVTWMAYGVWDDRFEAMCQDLTDAEIGTIVRAGVVPDAVVRRIAERWWSDSLPWEVIPFTMWDRVADTTIAREGRARTAAAKLIRDPALRDDRLIAAAACEAKWAAHVLAQRPDICDDRLITAAAREAEWAAHVLAQRPDICDDRLIAIAAEDPRSARTVLITRPDLCDDRLIQAAAKESWCARDVLIARPDLSDERLIAAVANATDTPWLARDVLIKRHDLCDDRLIQAAAKESGCAHRVLIERPDLNDDRLIAAVTDATDDPWYAYDILFNRPDLCDHRLMAAAAKELRYAQDILIRRTDVDSTHLIDAVAREPRRAKAVLIARTDLSDDRLIAAVATAVDATYAHDVLIARPDLCTDPRLLTTIARDRALIDNILALYPDLRTHPILTVALSADGSSG